MIRILWIFFVIVSGLHAEHNTTDTKQKRPKTQRQNKPNATSKNSSLQKKIAKQIAKEKRYAKEQKFYQADEYDFKGAQVDPETLKKIKAIQPDYDFDITDVYRDDI